MVVCIIYNYADTKLIKVG